MHVPLRATRRRVTPDRRIVEHDRHAVRNQRLAQRVARQAEVARKPRDRIREPVRQMAARRIERDSREHRGVHHFGSRLHIARIADGAHQILPHTLQRFGSQAVGERVGALRYGPACAACRVETPRPWPGGQRFQGVTHAIETAGGDHTPRQCRSHFGIDQRDRRGQPPRNDSRLGVNLGQI